MQMPACCRSPLLLTVLGCSVLAALVLAQEPAAQRPKYPALDGSGNNQQNPSFGQRGSPFIRLQVPEVANPAADGLAGSNRPSPREITVALLNKPYFKAASSFNSSYLLTALGQLVAQDISRGASAKGANAEPAPIKVPTADPDFWRFKDSQPVAQGSRTSLPYDRTNFTRLKPGGPRQQINEATAWLDASSLYGENATNLKAVRLGAAGRLLSDDETKLLAFNVEPATGKPKFLMKNLGDRLPQTELRLAGNANVNQNPLLLSIVTVLMREHNRRARLIEAANPDWGDEEIFQEARKWVIGHFQRITMVDYLSALGIAVPPYKGYNASFNPTIDNFFTSVSYRYGHSTINDVILRLDESWSTHPKGHLTLRNAYYNPNVALEAGLEPLIRGMIAQPQGKIEPRWAAAVAGNFVGDAATNGTDLAAINIQRGRDHGIPDYNSCRRALGLPAAKTFADITPDKEIAGILKELYGNVNNIDAYVGGLAEPHEGASHVGPLFTVSIKEQFSRLRDADWWYFENGANNKLFNQSEIDEIRSTSLRDILMRTTSIKDLPADIWTATSTMTCAADGTRQGGNAGAGRNKLVLPALLGGTASLEVQPAQEEGWVTVALTAAGAGWLGFAVADADSPSAMIGADMVVGRMVDGKPQVQRYRATAHQPPTQLDAAAQSGALKVVKFEQSGGKVHLEFERPASAGGDGRAMPVNQRFRLLVARGQSNDFETFEGYHGAGNREIIDMPEGLFGAASEAAADPKAIASRQAHGVLMAVNFIVVFPLGALAARQLRSHWLPSPHIRAALFYVHIITQVAGTACVTAGLIIATRLFNVPVELVQYKHGMLGVATLALVYSQLLLGFIRPTATAPTARRHLWDITHSTLGRAAMLIGLANVGLGIVIFSHSYTGNFSVWAGLCAAGLGAITLLQHVLDRQEKHAVLRNDREMLLASAQHEKGFDPSAHGAGNSFGLPPDSQPSLGDAAAAAGEAGSYGGGAHAASSGPLPVVQAAGPPAAAQRAGQQGPKLTANLLQRHEASAGGMPPNAGVTHPAFAPNGQQSGDIDQIGFDQGGLRPG